MSTSPTPEYLRPTFDEMPDFWLSAAMLRALAAFAYPRGEGRPHLEIIAYLPPSGGRATPALAACDGHTLLVARVGPELEARGAVGGGVPTREVSFPAWELRPIVELIAHGVIRGHHRLNFRRQEADPVLRTGAQYLVSWNAAARNIDDGSDGPPRLLGLYVTLGAVAFPPIDMVVPSTGTFAPAEFDPTYLERLALVRDAVGVYPVLSSSGKDDPARFDFGPSATVVIMPRRMAE